MQHTYNIYNIIYGCSGSLYKVNVSLYKEDKMTRAKIKPNQNNKIQNFDWKFKVIFFKVIF